MTERMEEWVYQIAAERADEIRSEFGYDEDLQDLIEEMIRSLDGDVKERVSALINRMERTRLDDYVTVYRGAFRDGLKYGISVVADMHSLKTQGD